MSWYGYRFRPYVPVAKRRAQAVTHAEKLAKKEKRELAPIKIEGRKIATSFWGNAWCENLERYSDFSNRLPRGRTYVRNGSVVDLQIDRGKVRALVSGSEVYSVTIDIDTLPAAAWSRLKKDCARSIDSLLDLLQGRFDHGIMERLTERERGLFPSPREIGMKCSCPDWASMCKHVAATLYGVGARLDHEPALLFVLRDVDHLELIGQAVDGDNLNKALKGETDTALAGADLGKMFGIELDAGEKGTAKTPPAPAEVAAPRPRAVKKPKAAGAAVRKVAASKCSTKKPTPAKRRRAVAARS